QSVDICNETTIKLAKSCIYFNKAGWLGYRVKRTGVTQFTAKPKKKTGVPRAFHWIHNPEAVPKLELKDQLKVYDSGAYRKLYIKTPRDKDEEPFFFVCKLCYADALCPLDNCLFKMVLSVGKPHGANLGKHLKNVHGFNDKGVREGESPAKRGCDDEGTSTVAVTVSDETRNPTPASKKAKIDSKIKSHFDVDTGRIRSELDIKLQEFHNLQLDLINNNNIAVRAITSKECPEFRKILLFFKRNYKILKEATDDQLVVSRYKVGNLLDKRFEFLLSCVSNQVADVRSYFISRTNKRQKFITVMFDGWDSKRKDLIGCTVAFYNPLTTQFVRVALGLAQAESKKSNACGDQILVFHHR
ncbi:MAG: hypothetical protein EAZ74_06985, partial [Alphaproteobacteria bacterium]